MIWTTWRQHRAEAAVGALILAALIPAMLTVGHIARDRSTALGLPTCLRSRTDCGDALDRLHQEFHSIPPFTFVLIALPLVVGMFWAAPLISREYEAGTHRLAWTQSISPLRWITTKIILIFAITAVAAAALGVLASWTLDPLNPAFGGRYNSTWYDVQGIVPIACTLFALAVGVAAGALIRRTIPAMAVTLVAYAGARIPIHWVRWHFAPLTSHTVTVPFTTLLSNITGAPRDDATSALPANAWLHDVTTTGPTGRRISGNQDNVTVLRPYCPDLRPNATRDGVLHPSACAARIRSLDLHETITYQPASHFWLIQTTEAAIFLCLAGILIATAILAVTRRRPT